MNMASRYSKSEQKVRRALAALDTAIQAWYAEHNPGNKNHYATVHICDYPEDGLHASRVTVQTGIGNEHYKDIASSKCSKELQ